MIDCALFVHGTGVRYDRYLELYAAVSAQVARVAPEVEVRPCYWADIGGVVLNSDGRSVPDYIETGGTAQRDTSDRWELLVADPWHEIRVLAIGRRAAEEPAPQRLESWLIEIQPKDERLRRFLGLTSSMPWEEACALVVAAPSFARLASTVGSTGAIETQVRRTVATAVLAAGVASVSGETTVDFDEVRQVERLLHRSAEAAVRGDLVDKAKTSAGAYLARRFGEAQRGERTDALAGFLGDILRYQAKGTAVRQFIRATVADTQSGSGIAIIGHSLGGIAAVDLLVESADDPTMVPVDLLVTIGSQAPFLFEIDALQSLDWGQQLPDHFPRWVNLYDRSDLLSYTAEPIFGRHASRGVRDIEVVSEVGFIASHSNYFFVGDESTVWNTLAAEFAKPSTS